MSSTQHPQETNQVNRPQGLTTDKLKSASHVNPKSKAKGKVFECTNFPPCTMSFTRYEHLARHIRKHTGERPFQCEFCNKRFSRLDNLRQHIHTVHNKDNLDQSAKLNHQSGAGAAAAVATWPQQQRPQRHQPQMVLGYPNIPYISQNQLPPHYILQRPYSANAPPPPPPNLEYQYNYYMPPGPAHMQLHHQGGLQGGQQQMQMMNGQQQMHHQMHHHQMSNGAVPSASGSAPPTSTAPAQVAQQVAPQPVSQQLPPPRSNTLLEKTSPVHEFRPRSNKPMPLTIQHSGGDSSSGNLVSPSNSYNHDSTSASASDHHHHHDLSYNIVTPSTATSVSSVANSSSNYSSNSPYSQQQYPMHYKSPLATYSVIPSPSPNGQISGFSSPYALNFKSYNIPSPTVPYQSTDQYTGGYAKYTQQLQPQQQVSHSNPQQQTPQLPQLPLHNEPLVDTSKYAPETSQKLRSLGLVKPPRTTSSLSRQYANSETGTDIDNDSDDTIKPFKHHLDDQRVNSIAQLVNPTTAFLHHDKSQSLTSDFVE